MLRNPAPPLRAHDQATWPGNKRPVLDFRDAHHITTASAAWSGLRGGTRAGRGDTERTDFVRDISWEPAFRQGRKLVGREALR